MKKLLNIYIIFSSISNTVYAEPSIKLSQVDLIEINITWKL